MPAIRIYELLFDDENSSKIAAHGIRTRQLQQVIRNEFVVARNRRVRRGSYLLVGLDDGGTCTTAPIEATGRRGVWRPVTAWPCKASEHRLLRWRRS